MIDQINLLPQLYDQVIIPQAVHNELADTRSPQAVKQWIENPPDWLEVQKLEDDSAEALEDLDLGERQAILLLEQLNADLLLVDDQHAREVAQARNIRIIGVLGILDAAASLGILDFPEVLDRLKRSTFEFLTA